MPPATGRRPLPARTVEPAGRSSGTAAGAAGTSRGSPVRALSAARSLPAGASARVVSRLTAGASDDRRDDGMTTAEYAVGTVAACGFSGLLYKVVTSPEVLGLLRDVVTKAFRLGF